MACRNFFIASADDDEPTRNVLKLIFFLSYSLKLEYESHGTSNSFLVKYILLHDPSNFPQKTLILWIKLPPEYITATQGMCVKMLLNCFTHRPFECLSPSINTKIVHVRIGKICHDDFVETLKTDNFGLFFRFVCLNFCGKFSWNALRMW